MPAAIPQLALSVVIPTYNRRASLLRTLAALARQTVDPATFEVLANLDGSTDGTLDACRTLAVPFTLRLFEQASAGPAGARNLGVREARAPPSTILDDDVVPDAELVAEHLRRHAEVSGAVVIGPLLPHVLPRFYQTTVALGGMELPRVGYTCVAALAYRN